MLKFIFVSLVFLGWANKGLVASEIIIAVASNFSQTAQKIVTKFGEKNHVTPILVSGSSGNILSQIKQGAPYDVFLSADTLRPKRLVDDNLAYADSLVTYAMGKLVLWSPRIPGLLNAAGLQDSRVKHIATANPKLAPYGLGTLTLIENLGVKKILEPKLVFAENVSQAKHFISSGNCELGFISLAQVIHEEKKEAYWVIPSSLYEPIQQSGVVLKRSKNEKIGRDFLNFILSAQIQKIIIQDGYDVPLEPGSDKNHLERK